MKKIQLFLVGIVISVISHSQVVQISDTLFVGGKIRTYAKNSNCLIVGNKGGVFKTTNNGQNWQNVSQNFGIYSNDCDQIVSLGNDFFAISNSPNSNDLFVSQDNGTSWNLVVTPLWWTASIGKLGYEIYVVGQDANGLRLISSINGTSWTPKITLSTGGWSGNLELLSLNPSKLYLLFNDSLFYTTNGTSLLPISFNGLSTSYFNDDEFGGDNSGNLYFRDDSKLYKYNFGNNTWSDISTGKIPSGYEIIECSFTENAIYILAFNQSLGVKLFKSINQGLTFTELITQGTQFPFFLNIIESSPNNLIANGLYGEIYISSNNGANWVKPATCFIANGASTLQLSGSSLILARENLGLIRSDNQGNNWTTSNTGLPGYSNIAYFVDDIIEVKNNLFATTNDFNTGKTNIYKSTNNGNSWSLLTLPSPYNNNDGVMFAGKCDSALFLNYYEPTSYNIGVVVSFDYGNTWIKPNAQNNYYTTFFKGTKNFLFSFNATNEWDDFDNAYKVINFGQIFGDISSYLTINNVKIKRLFQGNYGDRGNAVMDFDGQNINRAFFAVRENGIEAIYKYEISNNTWSKINTTGLPNNYWASYIKFIGNNTWLLATNYGLFKSINNCQNWSITHLASDWQKGMIVNQIHLIGNKAFLGTLSNGVWKVDLITGILEKVSENMVNIFPNPATDMINVSLPFDFGNNVLVSIFNVEGKLVCNESINGNTFNVKVSDFPKGTYNIRIISEKNTFNKLLILK